MNHSTLLLAAALTGAALGQSPIPQTAPRANWVASTLTTQLPVQVRESQGAASFDKMYVFGGRDSNAGTTTHNALYEFDGSDWTLKTANDAVGSPARRGGAAVAWNFATNKLVVFGGNSGTSATPTVSYNDTWEWDPITNAWTNVTPVTPSPSPRQLMTMAWEPLTGGMLLFGGNSGVVEGDTWLFIGGTWLQVGTAGPSTPAPRQQSSLVTRSNPEFLDVVMVGGQGGGVHFLDSWKWDVASSAWIQIVPTTAAIPPAVVANQGVYDALRKRIVLQGGNGIPTAQVPGYNAQPSGWCGEFDCVTNEWFVYGAPSVTTGDPVIGKVSRYFAAFVPALGKVYKVSGQANTNAMAMATYEYQATTVAQSNVLGAGCNGLSLTTDELPWTSRTVTATASGFGATSLGFALLGFGTQTVAINTLHPAGMAGCNLLVTPDVSFLLVPAAGTASFSVGVPAVAAFAGLNINLQAAQLELNAQLQLISLSSTNGVALTIGAL